MKEEITLEKITNLLATLQDYLEIYMEEGREKENAISRLAETVFWVTYAENKDEEI